MLKDKVNNQCYREILKTMLHRSLRLNDVKIKLIIGEMTLPNAYPRGIQEMNMSIRLENLLERGCNPEILAQRAMAVSNNQSNQMYNKEMASKIDCRAWHMKMWMETEDINL